MPIKMGGDSDEEDLDALRMAALRTIKSKPSLVISEPPQGAQQTSQHGPLFVGQRGAQGGWRGRGAFPGRGRGWKARGNTRGGQRGAPRGNGSMYPHVNGPRGGGAMFGGMFARSQVHSNLISIVTVSSEDASDSQDSSPMVSRLPPKKAEEPPRLVLPQDRYCKTNQTETESTEEDKSTISTKFSRYDRSDSEDSEEEEEDDNSKDNTKATEEEEEEEDPDVILMEDEDSLEKLLVEFGQELQDDKEVKPIPPTKQNAPATNVPNPKENTSKSKDFSEGGRNPSPPNSYSHEEKRSPPPKRLPESPQRLLRNISPPPKRAYSPLRSRLSPTPVYRSRRSITPERRVRISPRPWKQFSPRRRRSRSIETSPPRRYSPPRRDHARRRSGSPGARWTPPRNYRAASPRRRSPLSPRRLSPLPRRQSPLSRRLSPPPRRLSPGIRRSSPQRRLSPISRRLSPTLRHPSPRRLSPAHLRKRTPTPPKPWSPPRSNLSPRDKTRRRSRSPLAYLPSKRQRIYAESPPKSNRNHSRSPQPRGRSPASSSRTPSLSPSPPRGPTDVDPTHRRYKSPLRLVHEDKALPPLIRRKFPMDVSKKEVVQEDVPLKRKKESKTKDIAAKPKESEAPHQSVTDNPVLEARRRKFESSNPIQVGSSKKIRLRNNQEEGASKCAEYKDSPTSPVVFEEKERKKETVTKTKKTKKAVEADAKHKDKALRGESTTGKSRKLVKATTETIKEEDNGVTHGEEGESEEKDDLRAELRRRRAERLHKSATTRHILPTRLVQSALHSAVGSGIQKREKMISREIKETPKKTTDSKGKPEGRRVMVIHDASTEELKKSTHTSVRTSSRSDEMSSSASASKKTPVHSRLGSSIHQVPGRRHRKPDRTSISVDTPAVAEGGGGGKGRKVRLKRSNISVSSRQEKD